MRIKPTAASVVGQTTPTQWGQVLLSPTAYGVIEVASESGQARQRGVEVLSRLNDGLATPPKTLKEVATLAESVATGTLKTVLLLVPVGPVIYLSLRGAGAVYLKRADKVAVLVREAGDISGEIQEGDTLLLASSGFIQALSSEELTEVFDHLSPSEASEKLTLLLHEKSGGFGSAALVFQVTAMIPAEAEELRETTTVAQPPPREAVFRKGVSRKLPLLTRFSLKRFLAKIRVLPRHLLGIWGNSNKLVAAVTLILLFLFGVSVVLGIRRQASQKNNQSVTKVLDSAQHAFDEGVALLTLSPVKGRERLVQAKNLLEPLRKTVSARTSSGRQLASLYQKVNDNLTAAMQIVKTQPQLFFDASLLKKGAVVSSFYLNADVLAIADQASKAVYAVSVTSKKAEVMAGGGEYQGLSLVAAYGDKLYALVDGGIHMIRGSDKKTVPLVIKKDNQWGKIDTLFAFSGNLYLLDTVKSRVWKYVATENGFSDLREYLNPDTLPDLSRATSMAIDGSVWVGTAAGKVLRFTQGKENTFIPQGVDPGLGDNLVVYTSDVVKNLYILDVQNKRVVVLDKEGVYLAQYVWEDNFSPKQLAVSEANKKILFLAEGKIYSVDLK